MPTRVYYPLPLHKQPCFAHNANITGPFAVAERVAREVLSLPIHPFLTDAEVETIADAVARSADIIHVLERGSSVCAT